MFLSININQNYIYQGSLSSNIIRPSYSHTALILQTIILPSIMGLTLAVNTGNKSPPLEFSPMKVKIL